jgi:hypothetical protein
MAGTVTVTHTQTGRIGRIKVACVGDASGGTVPATALPPFAGLIVALRTNPGATAPTSNYDITAPDEHGVDRLQGVGANRHTTSSEEVAVVRAGTAIHPPVAFEDVLTYTVENQSVNSATWVTEIIYLA